MTPLKQIIALEEIGGRVFQKRKNPQGALIYPCPDCNAWSINFTDCGYSSFNPGSAKCVCGYELVAGYVDSWKNIPPLWNRHCTQSLPDYLHNMSAVRELLGKMTNSMKLQVLWKIMGWNRTATPYYCNDDILRIMDATPAQWCEAIIRVHGKFEGDESNANA